MIIDVTEEINHDMRASAGAACFLLVARMEMIMMKMVMMMNASRIIELVL